MTGSSPDAKPPRALWHVAPGEAALRGADLGVGDCEVRALWSLVSRGTERLVHEGRVPESEYQRMRAPHQEGDFPFPLKYGYAMVGMVEDRPEALIGRHVFALHPHQSRFRLPAGALVPLPPCRPAAPPSPRI